MTDRLNRSIPAGIKHNKYSYIYFIINNSIVIVNCYVLTARR